MENNKFEIQLRAQIAHRETVCPVCGKTFTTTVGNKRYCNIRCLKRAERARAQAAADNVALATRAEAAGLVRNPTIAQLSAAETWLVARGVEGGEYFIGDMPVDPATGAIWQPASPDVMFGPSATAGQWNMVYLPAASPQQPTERTVNNE